MCGYERTCGYERIRMPHATLAGISIFLGGLKKEGGARYRFSRAPPLLRQRKPYLTGSPPSRQIRRCRQNLSHEIIITPRLLWPSREIYFHAGWTVCALVVS